MELHVVFQFFLLFLSFDISECFPSYQNLIPNGNFVPDTCDKSDIWIGVGHVGPLGSGDRNVFGNDFAKYGRQWTKALCQLDSDGDGRTNGEELGDPLCLWKIGSNVTLEKAVSNPGICDPWNSTLCSSRNGSIDCSTQEIACTAMFNNDTKKINLMLPLIRVPLRLKTFVCMRFSLPTTEDYHVIASKPIYNNRKTVNYIAVFGCSSQVIATDKPYYCSVMPQSGCQELMAGYVPMCLDEHAGIQIGRTGYKHVLVQWFFNNPDLRDDVFDNSGIALYYTPKLRRYNMGVGTIVATGFTIPPKQLSYNVTSTCPGFCTEKYLTSDIHVAMTIDHMHLFGSKQKIEHIRNGAVLSILSHDDHFDPFNPGVFWNKDPIQVKPQDSFQMTCIYNTTLLQRKIGWGFDYSGEMCLGRIFYYPKESWTQPSCASYKSIPLCSLNAGGTVSDCNVNHFLLMLRKSPLFTTLKTDCAPYLVCTKTCLDHVARIRRHPCLQGDFYQLWQYPKYQQDSFLNKLYRTFKLCEKDYQIHGSFIHNSHAH